MYDPKALLAVAIAEIGYLEKETNSQLYDPKANAGDGNFTKYADFFDKQRPEYPYYNGKKQGVAYCDVFTDYCFAIAYVIDVGRQLQCQPMNSSGAGCRWSMGYYKSKGRFFDFVNPGAFGAPQPGDQIFFWPTDRTDPNVVQHTGLVERSDSKKVYTIEGNSSNGVRRRSYDLNYVRIAGYGRPRWDSEFGAAIPVEGTVKPYEPADDYPTLRKGSNGDSVSQVQRILKKLGYDLGAYGPAGDGIDGDFGKKTDEAVRKLQKEYGLTVDGVVGPKTWAVLINLNDDDEADTPGDEPVAITLYTATVPDLVLVDAQNIVAQYKGATYAQQS
jgi:hypothetical protein